MTRRKPRHCRAADRRLIVSRSEWSLAQTGISPSADGSGEIGFMIAHQDQPNHDEAKRPDPCQTFTRTDRFRKAKFQPARPSADDSENGDWCVAQLNKELLLHVV